MAHVAYTTPSFFSRLYNALFHTKGLLAMTSKDNDYRVGRGAWS